jgi:drug/metabolite transporter (DMT)-like permease
VGRVAQDDRGDGDHPRRAITAILLAVFALSLGDALIKRISAGFSLWQIFVVRSAIALPVLVLVLKRRDPSASVRPGNVVWTAVRSVLLTVMWVAYYAALPHFALPVAAAVYYTLPLFITLFAALFLGENVGLQGWIAVGLGFCGVLLVLKPQADDYNAYALWPLVSAIFYAFAMILTRGRLRGENPLVLSFALNLCFVAVGGAATALLWLWGPTGGEAAADPFLLGGWITMGPREWLAGGLLAAAILAGSVFAAVAYQSGPASLVATFDFAYLAFAGLWVILVFADLPDALTIVGIGLVATAGILAVRR